MVSLYFLWFQSRRACSFINATVVSGLLQPDSLGHGVPGKESFCAQRSGSQEYSGGRESSVQGRNVCVN